MTVDREAILDEWWFPIPLDQMPDYDRGELLDLISRAVDAAYEDAARAVEGESLHDNTGDPFDLAYMEAITDHEAAVRAAVEAERGRIRKGVEALYSPPVVKGTPTDPTWQDEFIHYKIIPIIDQEFEGTSTVDGTPNTAQTGKGESND